MKSYLQYDSILLIHPLGYSKKAARHDISRKANIMPPIGLLSMAAWVEKHGFKASVVDCFAFPDSDDRIRSILETLRPAFMGISTTTSSFLDGVRIAALAKRILPEITTIFGGPHVSALKGRILDVFAPVDIVTVGEGEETLLELMQNADQSRSKIPGIVCRNRSGETIFNGYRPKGIDLDTLPFPAYEKLTDYPNLYRLPLFSYPKAPNTSCISSRGCPYSCSYCDRSVFGRSFRFNSADYLYEHMRYLNRRFGIRHINFYDDQFTFHRKRVQDLTQQLVRRPLPMTFNCTVRAEHIDCGLLRRLKAAGCWMVSLGIETADQALLSRHRQNVDIDLLAEKIIEIHHAGLRTKGLLMMGLPGETETSIKKSKAFVFSLPIDEFNVSKFTPFPGSPIYERIEEYGTFTEDWEKMDCMRFLFVPHGFTEKRLEELHTDFYRTHYQRPRTMLNYASMVWKSPDSWLRMLTNAGDFIRFIRTNRRYS